MVRMYWKDSDGEIRYSHRATTDLEGLKMLFAEDRDMSFMDLSGRSFVSVDTVTKINKCIMDSCQFRGAMFERVAICKSELTRGLFWGATFTQCRFENVKFEGSTFRGATFTDCSFVRCNLSGADFSMSQLVRTRFKYTHTVNVEFTGAAMIDVDGFNVRKLIILK